MTTNRDSTSGVRGENPYKTQIKENRKFSSHRKPRKVESVGIGSNHQIRSDFGRKDPILIRPEPIHARDWPDRAGSD